MQAMKKTIVKAMDPDGEEGGEDFKKMVTEIWENDKKKLKDEIQKLNLEMEEIRNELDAKDDLIRKANEATEDINE